VHMSFLRCPVVGDRIYGRRKPSVDIQRHFLHASKLTFRLPSREVSNTFEAPLPDELAEVLERLRLSVK
jgi:23S rRNA pseudouridine1911/1915/1917 synthase